jgi:signal transduction histidine kinase
VGATDYIVKPYSIKILREKVDHWISRRRYEFLLKEASTVLEDRVLQLSRAKDIVLHEIGNPLQMIEGASYFVEKLKKLSYDKAPEAEKSLWTSVNALSHGIKAIRSVLETTKQFDVSEMSLRRMEGVDVIIDDAVAQTRHLLNGITLTVDIDRMEPEMVNCDRRMLVQVMVNLIRNGAEAIRERYGAEGGSIRVSSELNPDKRVLVKVKDDGVGMSPEVLERLFRFKYTSKKDGTGIGLHLSKMILKLHEGSISVESQQGAGTTFTLILPPFQKDSVGDSR